MRPTRPLVTGVAVWLLVVAVGSTLVWLVISRAGEGVVSSDAPAGTAPELPGPTVDPTVDPAVTPTRRPSSRPSATRSSPPATDPPEPSATTSPSAAPSSPSPPSSSSASAPPLSPPPPPAPPPDPQPVRRTWQGQGGLVTVECRGAAASLVSAIPDSGFGVEIDKRGPDRVEVEFEGRGENDARSRIGSSCVGGAPRFATDIDSG